MQVIIIKRSLSDCSPTYALRIKFYRHDTGIDIDLVATSDIEAEDAVKELAAVLNKHALLEVTWQM